MAHFALLWKARTIEKYRLRYENEKLNSIMSSNTEMPRQTFSQKWKHYHLSTKRHISTQFQKWYPEGSAVSNFFLYLRTDKTFLNFILKSLIGFIGGILLTYLCFMFLVYQLSISLMHAVVVSSFIGVLLTLGLAFSYRVRCLVFLLIPQFFSRVGRYTLTCYALILILTGPATNTLKNSEVLSESMACGQEQIKITVKNLQYSIANPINAIKDNIKAMINGLREVAVTLKTVVVKINRLILSVARIFESSNTWLESIVRNCNTRFGTPFDRCVKTMNEALTDLRASANPFSVRTVYKNDSFLSISICRSVRRYASSCGAVDVVNVAAVVRKRLKSFSNRIKSMLFLDAHLQRSYSFSSNSSRSASQVAAGIVTEIRKKADPLLTWLSWSSCVTSLFLLLILFRAKYYQHMFETRSRFDNRYITKELRDLDLRRLREGKETVLPLNRRERSKYITTTSFRLLPSERVYLSRSIVFMTITTFKLMIHMVADYSLYWVLTTIRYHGRFQTTRQAPDSDAGIHISGSGLISDFFMAVIRALSDPLMHRVPSPVACLPDPHPPDFQRYTQIGILIFLLWFVALFEPYGLRLRHVVMGHYRPERANARALWLYNHILRTRGFFMKYARRKLRREFKHSSDRKLTFSYWIHNVIPYPWLQNLLGTGPEDPHCILCGTTHLENDPDTNLTVCQSFNCPGTYCTRCYSDIGQMCTICMSPVDYGDFSDMSLEKGSSEEDEDDDAHFSSSFWHSHTLISETDLDIDKPLLRKSSKTNLDLGGAKIRRPSSHGLNEEVEEIRCRRNYITKQAMIRHIRFCNNRQMNTKMPKNIQSINVGDCKVCAMYKKHNDKTNKNHVQTPKYPINHSRQTLRKYKSRKSKYRFSKTLHKNNSFKCSSRRRGLRRSRNSDKWRNIEILQWKPFGKGPWPTRKKDKKQWKVNIQDSKYSCRSRAFGDCNNKGKNNSTRTTKASKKGGAQQPNKEEDQIKKNKSLEDKFRKKNVNNWRRSEGIKLMKTGKKPSVYGVFRNKFSNIWKHLTMKSHIDIQTNTDPKKKENHKRKKKLQTAWSNTEVMISKRKQDEESRKHRISSFLDDQDWRKRGQIHERNFPECIEIGESAELTQSKVLKTEAEILKDIIFEKTQQLTLDPQIKLTIEPGATDVTSRVLQIVDYLEELLSINSEAKKKVSSKTEKDIKKSGSNFKYNLEINDPALPMEYLDLFYEPRNTSSQANIPLIPLDKLSRSLPRINVHRVHKSDGKHKRALTKLPQKSVNKIPTVRSSVIGVHSEKKKKSVVRKEHKTEHRRRHDKRNKAANDKGDNDKVTNSKETNNIEVNNEQPKNDTEYEKTNNKETHNKGTNANGDCEKTTTNKSTKDKDVKIPKDVNKVDNTNQVDFHYENPLFTYSSEKNESCASDNKEMATNTKWYLDMITAGATAPAKQIEKILEVENKEEVDKKVESKQVPKLVGKDIERAACKKGYSKQDKKLYCSKCMAYTSKGKCGCKITSNSRSSVIKCCYYSNNSSSFDKYLSLKMRQIMESLIKCSEIPEIPEKVDELNGTVECTSKCCQYESPPSFSKGIAGPSFNSILTSLDMGGQVPSLCLSSNRSLSGVTQASYCHEDVAICPKYAAQKFLENILKDPCVCVDTSTSFDSFPKYKSVEPNNKPVQSCKYKSTPSSSRAPQPRKTVKTNEKAAKGKPLPKQKIVKKYVKSQDKFTPDISEETSCDECKGCIDDSSTLSITVSVRESISHDDKVKKPIKKFESKKMKGFKKVFKKTKKTKCICFDEKTSTTELKAVTRDNSCKCPDLKELFGYDPNGPLEKYLRRGAHPNEPEKVTKYVQYEKSYGTEPKDKHTEDSRQYKTVGVGGNFMILVDRDVQTPDDMFPDLGSSPPIPREMTDSDQPKKSKCTCAIQCCGKKLSGSSVDDQKSNAGMYMSWCPNDKKPEKQLREIPLQRDRNVRSTTKLRITEPLQDRTYRSTTKLQVKDPPDEPDNRNTRQLQRQPIVNNAARSTVQMKMEDDDNHKKAETKAAPPANGISFEVKKAANKPAGNTSVNKGEREGKKQRRPRSYTIIGRVKHSHAAFKPNADDGRCEFCKRNNAVTSKQVSFNDEVIDITACAVCGKKKESLAMENVFSTNRYLKQRNKLLLRTDSHQNIYFVG